jgi:hypothetical protein
MQMDTSKVKNSAQVLSCQLKFVHGFGSNQTYHLKNYEVLNSLVVEQLTNDPKFGGSNACR